LIENLPQSSQTFDIKNVASEEINASEHNDKSVKMEEALSSNGPDEEMLMLDPEHKNAANNKNHANHKMHVKASSILEIHELVPMSVSSMRNKSPGSKKKNSILNKSELCRSAKEKTEFYNSLVHVS